jgi:hypothetical protein
MFLCVSFVQSRSDHHVDFFGQRMQVDGLVVAPKSPSAWKSSGASAHWIQFTDCTRFTLKGKGIFDGSGAAFWAKGGSSRPMVSTVCGCVG